MIHEFIRISRHGRSEVWPLSKLQNETALRWARGFDLSDIDDEETVYLCRRKDTGLVYARRQNGEENAKSKRYIGKDRDEFHTARIQYLSPKITSLAQIKDSALFTRTRGSMNGDSDEGERKRLAPLSGYIFEEERKISFGYDQDEQTELYTIADIVGRSKHTATDRASSKRIVFEIINTHLPSEEAYIGYLNSTHYIPTVIALDLRVKGKAADKSNLFCSVEPDGIRIIYYITDGLTFKNDRPLPNQSYKGFKAEIESALGFPSSSPSQAFGRPRP